MRDLSIASIAITPGFRSVTGVGSRRTVDPPPTDTDDDYLVHVRHLGDALSFLKRNGFVLEGRDSDYGGSSTFKSLRRGETNFIVSEDEDFVKKFLVATRVAKRLNLKDKEDRKALFQAILYANG